MRMYVAVMILPLVLGAAGCAHDMEVLNMADYTHPAVFRDREEKLDIMVLKSSVDPKATWLLNAVTRELSSRREVGRFSTESAGEPTVGTFQLSIDPKIAYDTSGWNFVVNFPGGIIFAPAWHGYNYAATISTTISIHDESGSDLKQIKIDTPYYFRHADFGRCWWPIFQFSIFNFIGGTYTSLSYDDDATAPFERAVESNYASFVVDKLLTELITLDVQS